MAHGVTAAAIDDGPLPLAGRAMMRDSAVDLGGRYSDARPGSSPRRKTHLQKISAAVGPLIDGRAAVRLRQHFSVSLRSLADRYWRYGRTDLNLLMGLDPRRALCATAFFTPNHYDFSARLAVLLEDATE
jgi:hypothetical protein